MRPTKLVYFEGITKPHNVNIMLYESKKDSRKDVEPTWWLVFGKIQYKSDLSTVNTRILGGHCFRIKKMDVLCKNGNVKAASRYLCKTRT